jgi:phage-related protein
VGREIIFYETESGRIPVKEFLDNQSHAVFKKIVWTLQLIKENDFIPRSYFKKLESTDGIWEVRIRFNTNTYRIFSFWDKGNLIILTHGIIKKSQRTPVKEIKLAEKYKKDYFRRKQ